MLKLFSVLLFFSSSFCLSQDTINSNQIPSNVGYFEGKHGIDLNIGFYDNITIASLVTETGITSTSTTNSSGGFVGSISYQYWFKNYLAFRIGAGALISNVETEVKTNIGPTFDEVVSSEVATVSSLLAGLTFYPLQLTDENKILPYISLTGGPFVGIYSKSEINADIEEDLIVEETIIETVIGGKIAAGFDVLIGSIFKMGLSIGYNFIGDFSQPIGSETNYNGPEYSIVFGFVF